MKLKILAFIILFSLNDVTLERMREFHGRIYYKCNIREKNNVVSIKEKVVEYCLRFSGYM